MQVAGRLSSLAEKIEGARGVERVAVPAASAVSIQSLVLADHAGAQALRTGQQQLLQEAVLGELTRHAAAETERGEAVATVEELKAFAEACGTAAQQVGLQERPFRRLQGHGSALGIENLPYTKGAISGRWLKVCCACILWRSSFGQWTPTGQLVARSL
jgi:hypothetical protein